MIVFSRSGLSPKWITRELKEEVLVGERGGGRHSRHGGYLCFVFACHLYNRLSHKGRLKRFDIFLAFIAIFTKWNA